MKKFLEVLALIVFVALILAIVPPLLAYVFIKFMYIWGAILGILL